MSSPIARCSSRHTISSVRPWRSDEKALPTTASFSSTSLVAGSCAKLQETHAAVEGINRAPVLAEAVQRALDGQISPLGVLTGHVDGEEPRRVMLSSLSARSSAGFEQWLPDTVELLGFVARTFLRLLLALKLVAEASPAPGRPVVVRASDPSSWLTAALRVARRRRDCDWL